MISKLSIPLLSLLLVCLSTAPCPGQGKDSFPYRVEKVAGGFKHPVHLTHAGDGSGRVFVVEQQGYIQLLEKDRPGTIFLDIRKRVITEGEMGLLSVAFHPGFKENHRLFVNYTNSPRRGSLDTVVSELEAVRGNLIANPRSEKEVLRVKQPYANHNGGQILFGPDGMLYVGMGDGGSGNDPHGHGQSLSTLLGAVLRLNVDGKGRKSLIPADNPFVDKPGARPEIWAYGLRNPWRITVDRATGQMWTGDVGQNLWEEIDILEKGKNYGWNIMEGNHCFRPKENCITHGLTMPVKDYGRKQGISVTGGFVYRGKALPGLAGTYIYGDFGSGAIWSLRMEGGKRTEDRQIARTRLRISSFGEDENGELYICSHTGSIHRLVRN